MVSRDAIEAALDRVPDPELPISIVALGMVCGIEIDGGSVEIQLIPTYTGCPALPVIQQDVHAEISSVSGVATCTVTWRYEPAWTPSRISESGQEALRAHGVTTPCCGQDAEAAVHLTVSAIACPFCGSTNTRLDSPFGPTRCRSIHFCDGCRNQFEHIKQVSE
ncbi:MAG: phenylacetate-CoA oxygenase subunit PaaJ [Phycisphaerales bacterium]|jgi:ring-1,2-phenylacetyl-CoA epoxidase subunit PaaD|nr:phenylacetate-CoA oxygenase subunit PaaJ [Phycisphaerales bacterium]